MGSGVTLLKIKLIKKDKTQRRRRDIDIKKGSKIKKQKTKHSVPVLWVERVMLVAEGIIDTGDTLRTLDVRQLTKVVAVGRG